MPSAERPELRSPRFELLQIQRVGRQVAFVCELERSLRSPQTSAWNLLRSAVNIRSQRRWRLPHTPLHGEAGYGWVSWTSCFDLSDATPPHIQSREDCSCLRFTLYLFIPCNISVVSWFCLHSLTSVSMVQWAHSSLMWLPIEVYIYLP